MEWGNLIYDLNKHNSSTFGKRFRAGFESHNIRFQNDTTKYIDISTPGPPIGCPLITQISLLFVHSGPEKLKKSRQKPREIK